MTWLQFSAVFAAFFLTHSLPTRPKTKGKLVQLLGARGFTLTYSLLSLTMLAALIYSARRAPFVQLWLQSPWQMNVVQIGMFGVCLLLAFTFGRPNPFSFGGSHDAQFDLADPGIVRWTRHPVLLALFLWSGLHLLPNGDLAHVILFGVFACFAGLGGRLLDRRKMREMGAAEWYSALDQINTQPRFSRPKSIKRTAIRGVLAIVIYCALIGLHPSIIGVSAIRL